MTALKFGKTKSNPKFGRQKFKLKIALKIWKSQHRKRVFFCPSTKKPAKNMQLVGRRKRM